METSRTSNWIPLSERKASATWQGGQPGWLNTITLCFCILIQIPHVLNWLFRIAFWGTDLLTLSSSVIRLRLSVNQHLEQLWSRLLKTNFERG